MKGSDQIDTFVSHISDLFLCHSESILWTEDYLARPGDPILHDPARSQNIAVGYLGDTVTYFVRGRLFSTSGRANHVARIIRSMSVWNGCLLRRVPAYPITHGNISAELAHHLLTETLLVFTFGYGMDGLVFYEPDRGPM